MDITATVSPKVSAQSAAAAPDRPNLIEFGIYRDSRAEIMTGGIWYHYRNDWLAPWNLKGPFKGRSRRYPNLRAYVTEMKPRRIAIYRTYALGDILMLMTPLRLFRRTLGLEQPIVLVVQDRFFKQFQILNGFDPDFWFMEDRGLDCAYKSDIRVDFNGVLEGDHRGGPESDVHRVELYCRAIGI